jgi:hypothetical protein
MHTRQPTVGVVAHEKSSLVLHVNASCRNCEVATVRAMVCAIFH